jgi:hypothetical protein
MRRMRRIRLERTSEQPELELEIRDLKLLGISWPASISRSDQVSNHIKSLGEDNQPNVLWNL